MSVTLTPQQFAMLDSKVKDAIMSASAAVPAAAAAAVPVSKAGSVISSGEKRKGPKKLTEMTPEERAAHDVKIAERKVAREALSPEEKEAAKAAAALKKAAKEALKPMKADPVERAERAPSPVKEKAE